MVHTYMRIHRWVQACHEAARTDDRGVTVEKVIIVGIGALMAVAAMTTIGQKVADAVSRINFGF